jgi:hypothetical protein
MKKNLMHFRLTITVILIGLALNLFSQSRKQLEIELNSLNYRLAEIRDSSQLKMYDLLLKINEVTLENQRLESNLINLKSQVDLLTSNLEKITERLTDLSTEKKTKSLNHSNEKQPSPGVVPTPGEQGPTNRFSKGGISGSGADLGQGNGSGTGKGDGEGEGDDFVDRGLGGTPSRIRYPATLSKYSGLPADVVTISFKLTVRPDGTVRRAEEVLSTASHTIKPSILTEVKAEILRKIRYKPAAQETINWFTLVIYSK